MVRQQLSLICHQLLVLASKVSFNKVAQDIDHKITGDQGRLFCTQITGKPASVLSYINPIGACLPLSDCTVDGALCIRIGENMGIGAINLVCGKTLPETGERLLIELDAMRDLPLHVSRGPLFF